MAGTKRSHSGDLVDRSASTTMAQPQNKDQGQEQKTSPILAIFETFRDELDEHYDRRERIIKTSRDITALSKKMYTPSYTVLCWLGC